MPPPITMTSTLWHGRGEELAEARRRDPHRLGSALPRRVGSPAPWRAWPRPEAAGRRAATEGPPRPRPRSREAAAGRARRLPASASAAPPRARGRPARARRRDQSSKRATHPVQVMTNNGPVIGVIGSIPPHLLDESKKSKPMDIKNMLIDIGADDRADAEKIGIRPGQSILPICPFTPMANEKKILAKAWDNRYGCGLAIELLQEVKDETLPNILYSGATVQEEVGLRGAQTAATMINPDIFFALDASPANDMSGSKSEFGQLGKGALLRILDRSMVTHRGMREFILDTAETNKIPYQYFVSQGGTDAGRVHQSNEGVPSGVIGICSRYIHTHASIIHTDDYAAAKELIVKLVKSLRPNNSRYHQGEQLIFYGEAW